MATSSPKSFNSLPNEIVDEIAERVLALVGFLKAVGLQRISSKFPSCT
jgi:hypothetical protein